MYNRWAVRPQSPLATLPERYWNENSGTQRRRPPPPPYQAQTNFRGLAQAAEEGLLSCKGPKLLLAILFILTSRTLRTIAYFIEDVGTLYHLVERECYRPSPRLASKLFKKSLIDFN